MSCCWRITSKVISVIDDVTRPGARISLLVERRIEDRYYLFMWSQRNRLRNIYQDMFIRIDCLFCNVKLAIPFP